MTRISNSKLDLYVQCPRKYKFKYLEKVKGDYTATPLLFGSAMDNALNYILESIRDKKDWTKEEAERIFIEKMKLWTGDNPLQFFKNELPPGLEDGDESDPDVQHAVWNNIVNRGIACLNVYINDVLPLIDEVLVVQGKGELKNAEEDVFEFIIDAVVKLKDGRVVLLDNKTSSARYPKNKVIKSQQLSLYLESYPEIKYAGYAVLIKNPEKERGITFQFMVDEIPEETTAASFKLLEDTLLNIKQEKFPCNFKSCGSYGKRCEYEIACTRGDYTGLIPSYPKKSEEPLDK